MWMLFYRVFWSHGQGNYVALLDFNYLVQNQFQMFFPFQCCRTEVEKDAFLRCQMYGRPHLKHLTPQNRIFLELLMILFLSGNTEMGTRDL